ncbi:hypothetical protein [Carp edema virus]|nr:hypothetical protein [Carp edema virus]
MTIEFIVVPISQELANEGKDLEFEIELAKLDIFPTCVVQSLIMEGRDIITFVQLKNPEDADSNDYEQFNVRNVISCCALDYNTTMVDTEISARLIIAMKEFVASKLIAIDLEDEEINKGYRKYSNSRRYSLTEIKTFIRTIAEQRGGNYPVGEISVDNPTGSLYDYN